MQYVVSIRTDERFKSATGDGRVHTRITTVPVSTLHHAELIVEAINDKMYGVEGDTAYSAAVCVSIPAIRGNALIAVDQLDHLFEMFSNHVPTRKKY